MNRMHDSITDGPTDPDDRPEVDEEIRDSLENDALLEILYGIGKTMDELKDYPYVKKQG